MSEFELFDEALEKFENISIIDEKVTKDCCQKCEHKELINENGIISCLECGEEISHSLNHGDIMVRLIVGNFPTQIGCISEKLKKEILLKM